MILVITYKEDGIEKVSHGVDCDTLKTVVLPYGMQPRTMGAIFDVTMNEWVLL
jgi:hypothetical protein